MRLAWVVVGALLLACPGFTACTSNGDGTSLTTCGHTPVSDSPYASRVVLTLSAPASARPGDTIQPRLAIRAIGNRVVRLVDVGQPALLYLTRHDDIVGRYSGVISGTGYGTTLSQKPTPFPVMNLLLSGCPRGKTDLAHPDATRRPLLPGRYQIVATIDTSEDATHHSQLVSEPITITITNRTSG